MADPALEHEAPSLEGISCLGAGGIKGSLSEPPLLQHSWKWCTRSCRSIPCKAKDVF